MVMARKPMQRDHGDCPGTAKRIENNVVSMRATGQYHRPDQIGRKGRGMRTSVVRDIAPPNRATITPERVRISDHASIPIPPDHAGLEVAGQQR